MTIQEVELQISDLQYMVGMGVIASSIDGRSHNFSSFDDLLKAINYFKAKKTQISLERKTKYPMRNCNLGGGSGLPTNGL